MRGPQYGHVARCTCKECKAAFTKHNEPNPCSCAECAMYREAYAPPAVFIPPPDVPSINPYVAVPPRYSSAHNYGAYPEPPKRDPWKPRQSMATINMCERPGCDAIIKGPAVGTVYIRVNAAGEGERVEETKDYCPACVAEIVSMLDSEPISDRKKAYDKPYVRRTEVDDVIDAASDEQLAAVLFQRLMKQAQRQLPSTVDGHEE